MLLKGFEELARSVAREEARLGLEGGGSLPASRRINRLFAALTAERAGLLGRIADLETRLQKSDDDQAASRDSMIRMLGLLKRQAFDADPAHSGIENHHASPTERRTTPRSSS